MSSSRPSLIKVGHMDFRVLYMDENEWHEDPDLDDNAAGMTQGYSGFIWVKIPDVSQNEAVTREILLHEILHAIYFVAGLATVKGKEMKDWEEESIQRLTPLLLGVFRDNPELSYYLTTFNTSAEDSTPSSGRRSSPGSKGRKLPVRR